jgi:hypothetical protein
VVGTVAGGLPYDERCWTAPHTHVELMNVHNWSCYNRGYHVGSHLNMHDFVGFAGGKRVSDVLQACP